MKKKVAQLTTRLIASAVSLFLLCTNPANAIGQRLLVAFYPDEMTACSKGTLAAFLYDNLPETNFTPLRTFGRCGLIVETTDVRFIDDVSILPQVDYIEPDAVAHHQQ